MAINSKRRAISHMVYGALPPHSTNVLWMDTSVPELPVCKIFWNGCWTSVHTDESKEIELLTKVIGELSATTESQENTIAQLSEQILTAIQAIDLSGVATEANATTNKEAILTAVSNLQTALQGGDTTATLTALKEAIALLPTASAIQNGLAKETSVKDGNDTAISVAKEVRSEVGTGSDTAAEIGTLFAVVKWVKDKVKSIFNYIGTPATGQPSTLFAAIAAGGGGGGEVITYPTIQMTAASTDIDPNKVYIWGEMSAITITALNAGEAGVANVYFLEFYSGSTATTLTLPASVTDVRGTVVQSRIINVAIFNNIAYIA